MCNRLFFNDITPEKLEAHYERLCLESAHAIRQMIFPGFKVKAAKITSIPVAVVAAGKDYFFEFQRLQNWAEEYRYDFGETITKWLNKKITTN